MNESIQNDNIRNINLKDLIFNTYMYTVLMSDEGAGVVRYRLCLIFYDVIFPILVIVIRCLYKI